MRAWWAGVSAANGKGKDRSDSAGARLVGFGD